MTALILTRASSTGAHGAIRQQFETAMQREGFTGTVDWDPLARAAASTDNSVYQIVPMVIAAPRHAADVSALMRARQRGPFSEWTVTARGGGTGTNGQSLNTGIVIDFRRFMGRILALNVAEGWVDVEPGVVLDQLNETLSVHGLFFAPETSTSNRCTIGGMIGTDASGKGSRIYGKTSDNVLGMDLVTADGKLLDSLAPQPDWAQDMLAEVAAACDDGRGALLDHVPDISRRFTGYDLERARPDANTLEWWRLVLGAEGTLGLTVRARLKLTPVKQESRLIVLAFRDFYAALSAASRLLVFNPVAVETMDETVQGLARKAGLLSGLPEIIRGSAEESFVYNFVELKGNDPAALDELARRIETESASFGATGAYVASRPADIKKLWSIRSASVGLLGKLGEAASGRRPVAFMEDCVVPPDALAPFIADLRRIFAQNGLAYGIYGHVDVGCMHIRPALNLDAELDRALFRSISDQVYRLVKRYGGIFWGEHGKGLRGEYLADFVGPNAYAAFRRIKAAFDPQDVFNRGKLVTSAAPVMGLEDAPFRSFARPQADPLATAFACNGNALCLSYAAAVPMCPSFKASGDLSLSPKGRAEGLRQWHGARTSGDGISAELEEALYGSLDKCLSCKACASSCPVHVDIPEMKSHFLEAYHSRRRRPLSDVIALLLERSTSLMRALRGPLRLLQRLGANRLVGAVAGLRDLPMLTDVNLARHGVETARWSAVASQNWDERTVFVVQDPFNGLFDGEALLTVAKGLDLLGYRAVVLPPAPTGKTAQVKGARKVFARQAKAYAALLRRLARTGRAIVGADAAFVLMLRNDYPKIGLTDLPPVLLVQEFLRSQLQAGASWPKVKTAPSGTILLHCTEATALPSAGLDWTGVLAGLGIDGVAVKSTGCCGMSGIFGHESRNYDTSKALFDRYWAEQIASSAATYATGFSCRCQVVRFAETEAAHPMQLIVDALS